MQGFASLPGPDPALPSGSQGPPPAGTHPVSPGCGIWSRKLILVFFSRQQPLPLIPGCPGSPCAPPRPPGCEGTVSAREQPPSQLGPSSQGPGSGIWDGVGTGALPQGVLRGEGSTEAETHDTDPRNGWWLFFLSFIVTD